MENNIKEIKYQNFRWINIERPSRSDMEYLREKFAIHPLDLEDIIAPTQRSKIDKYEKYTFLILIFPFFNRKTREIESSEVDIFIGKDFLIMVHEGNLPPLVDLFQLCQSSEQARINYMGNSPQITLYHTLNKLFLYCYPILDHINLDTEEIKKQIFSGNEKKMVENILVIRRNITDMRKIMQAHKTTLQKLVKKNSEEKCFYLDEKNRDYYDHLIDYTKEIWDQLGTFKESIEALQQTNESLISFQINKVMKTLTIISVILLPASFIVDLFMTNAEHTPFIGQALDFFYILGFSLFASLIMIYILWKKKWF